jgi:hypothetical protein
MKYGGVPERSNGAVLKTAGGRKVARGFKSHPRRLAKPNPHHSFCRWGPLETAGIWRLLARPARPKRGLGTFQPIKVARLVFLVMR